MANRKKILYIANATPFGHADAREKLDLLMMLASFEVNVSILFMDNGVLQLLNTDNEEIQARAFSPVLKSFEHYEINKLYALDSALAQFGIDAKQLIIETKIISESQVSELIHQFDYVFKG